MQEATVPVLMGWENFYVIIGSASAALIGLMFVTITLVTSIRRLSSLTAVNAYSTPTVVHFCAALLIAALMNAPWSALWGIAVLLGAAGLAGMIYIGIVLRRLRQADGYQPVLEDWLFHFIFPFVGYVTLFVCALLLLFVPAPSLFCIAAATVLFLFIGIHNAWDTVTYVPYQFAQEQDREPERDANSRRSS